MKKILLLAFIAFATFSCDDKDEVTPIVPEPKKSITAIAAANPDLSTLVKLLKRTGLDKTLDGAGTYTVFAPTNSSFNSFASESAIASLPDETVKNLLLNHVLVVKKKSTDLKTEYVNTLATGPGGKYLSLYVDLVTNKDKVTLNGKVKVSSPNIEASNGIIHVVDGVLTLPTLVDAAIANPNLSTLVATLTNTAQANTLKVLQDAKTSTPLTVFAPVDSAFKTALESWAKNATQEQLTTVLQYHVATAGNVTSKDLKDGQIIGTAGGQNLKVGITPTAVSLEDQSTFKSKVSLADIQCINGVVHVIDRVFEPSFTIKK